MNEQHYFNLPFVSLTNSFIWIRLVSSFILFIDAVICQMHELVAQTFHGWWVPWKQNGDVQCSVNGQINLHNYLTMHTSIYCMSYLSLWKLTCMLQISQAHLQRHKSSEDRMKWRRHRFEDQTCFHWWETVWQGT